MTLDKILAAIIRDVGIVQFLQSLTLAMMNCEDTVAGAKSVGDTVSDLADVCDEVYKDHADKIDEAVANGVLRDIAE